MSITPVQKAVFTVKAHAAGGPRSDFGTVIEVKAMGVALTVTAPKCISIVIDVG